MTRKTNVEVITDLMEFSKYGVMAQLFVMDALSKHARQVADAPPEAFESMTGMISPIAWQGVAREIAAKLDAHLEVQKTNAVAPAPIAATADKVNAMTFSCVPVGAEFIDRFDVGDLWQKINARQATLIIGQGGGPNYGNEGDIQDIDPSWEVELLVPREIWIAEFDARLQDGYGIDISDAEISAEEIFQQWGGLPADSAVNQYAEKHNVSPRSALGCR